MMLCGLSTESWTTKPPLLANFVIPRKIRVHRLVCLFRLCGSILEVYSFRSCPFVMFFKYFLKNTVYYAAAGVASVAWRSSQTGRARNSFSRSPWLTRTPSYAGYVIQRKRKEKLVTVWLGESAFTLWKSKKDLAGYINNTTSEIVEFLLRRETSVLTPAAFRSEEATDLALVEWCHQNPQGQPWRNESRAKAALIII